MTTLSLKDLSRLWGDTVVVDRLNLELSDGEFVSLLGPSGCGKTTTLRMIAGFVDPSEGSIALDGKIISSPSYSLPSQARNMSMIFQSYAVWPHMTIRANVAFGLKLRRCPRDEIVRRTDEVLELVRMRHLADRYPAELSGGQQQRVALARALVIRPAVLLLDEPLSNLDASLRDELRREIRRLHDELRITTIYVTHDQAEAMSASDRIAVMNRGRIEQIADPQTIYTRPATEFVAGFIGRTNLLAGRYSDGAIIIDGLQVKLPLASAGSTRPGGRVALSVRPHDIRLSADPPAENGGCVAAIVRERSFLGDSWSYLVTPIASGPPLAVTAPPNAQFALGDRVWASLDLTQAVVLPQ